MFQPVTEDDEDDEYLEEYSFTEDLGNGVFLEMIAIPGGSFWMGSPNNEKERYTDEGQQQSVNIKPFYIAKFTVTQKQWRAVAALPQVEMSLNLNPSHFSGDYLPVESISWFEAVEFCHRLSLKSGRDYRLPSEAEWEYACRAGTTTPFHFGNTITTDLANYDGTFTYDCGSKGNFRQKTTAVGSFPANDFGLYDMHGNVWEWCYDYGALLNGNVGEKDNNNRLRVVPGGSYSSIPRSCRCANRYRYQQEYRGRNIGFRVVCY